MCKPTPKLNKLLNITKTQAQISFQLITAFI